MADGLETRGTRVERRSKKQVKKDPLGGPRGAKKACEFGCRGTRGRCDQIHQNIKDLVSRQRKGPRDGIKGLEHRFEEQVTGKSPPGSKGWADHEVEYERQRSRLNRELDRYDHLRCGERKQSKRRRAEIRKARKWAGTKAPSPSQHVGPRGRAGSAPRGGGLRGGGGGCGCGKGPMQHRLLPLRKLM